MRVAIVGAGLAGLACAAELGRGGHAVTVFDKGCVPGGRMSTRTLQSPLGPASFDHGAQYFTARDEAFRAEVGRWQAAGLAAPWPAAGAEAWVGTPGMSAPALALARGCEVRSSVRVDSVRHDAAGWRLEAAGGDVGPFDALAVALPAEQAAALIGPADAGMAAEATGAPSQPCWTVMAAFAERLPIADDVLTDRAPLSWAARNGAKPARSGPEAWVLQATPDWSRRHLEDLAFQVEAALLDVLTAIVGRDLPSTVATAAHRWRFARSGRLKRDALWNPDLRLGACGDWLLGPRVECAWMSGRRLAGLMSV